jgi:DNA-directed RNA polymerase specialized sigma24 family protein
MTDNASLLEEYARTGSEGAFRELVRRYIDFVHSTAVRLVGTEGDLARDVTQTVFIHLARSAERISGPVMLGGWLHRDTCNVAAKVLRGQRRRQARERHAKIVGYAFRMYANNHLDQFPSDFAQVIPYMDEALRADMNPGDVLRDRDQFIAQVTNRFEIVYTGSTTNEADTSKILFREKQATQASDGTWIKAYCFVDGSGQLHSEPDGNFESWEKQHMPGYSETQQGR